MLKDFYSQPGVVARLRCGPLAEQLDQLVITLQNEGYARDSIRISVSSAAKFSRWLERRECTAGDVTDALVDQYLSGIRRYPSGKQRKCVQGLAHMVRLLRQQGVLAIAQDTQLQTNTDSWLSEYKHYLTNVAGLRESTCIVYCRNARYMLTALFPDDRVDWTSVDAEILCNFVRQQAQNRRGAGRKTPGIVVRSFVRFLAYSGELDRAISGAIPTIRQSTHAALPTRLCTDDVERILNAVRESGLPEAARDYAILLMLSQLGMRSCEIANLRLEDIDWAKGQLLIRPGKTHQERALPLSQEVGNAIADYIQHARTRSASPMVFLRSCPPFTPFASPGAIGGIAKRAMHRSGVAVHAGMAAHTFRHTAASEMVNKGATFKDVADVLGHRSLETTGIYAKLDLNNLLHVAMPWTGEAS